MEMYCVKCKKRQEIADVKEDVTKTGRQLFRGTCPECGTKTTRIGGKVEGK